MVGPFGELSLSFLNPWMLVWLVPLVPLVVLVGVRGLHEGRLWQKLTGVGIRLVLAVAVLGALAVLLLIRRPIPLLDPWLLLFLVAGILLVWWMVGVRRVEGRWFSTRWAIAAGYVVLSLLVVFAAALPALRGRRLALLDPWVLVFLLALGLFVWFTARVRQSTSIAIRLLILLLVVAAAAEAQLVRLSDRLTVMFLLDRSLSVPEPWRGATLDYVRAVIRQQRGESDAAGVIAFGKTPAIEIPPLDFPVEFTGVESLIDMEHTDLASAIKLAQAVFLEDSAKRIVVISDGNENLSSVLEPAQVAAAGGIGIDVLPIEYQHDSEVLVEKIVMPSDVRQGEMVNLRVVVRSTRPARGTLYVYQRAGQREVPIAQQTVDLKPEPQLNVFQLQHRIDRPDFYTFEARFVPEDSADDRLAQNNRVATFTYVQGAAKVLLVEQRDQAGQHDYLADHLRQENLEVDATFSENLPSEIGELQPYDTIILANVPREHFSDRQLTMLDANTHDMGAGLVMLGGPDSFGAGGWMNTPVEKALPVDMEIKAAKVVPKGALVMIMHASEMAQGNYWQKVIAKEALRTLGHHDYAGLVHWSGREAWLWGGGLISVGPNRERMLARIDRMTPGDMPDFGPSLQMARDALWARTDAAVKHIIIISDGDPSPPTSMLVRSLQSTQPGRKISVSTVAVAAHGPMDLSTMRKLAEATSGRFYNATNPKALPRIFQKEARRISRPLIYEKPEGLQPAFRYETEPLVGVPTEVPPITGYVMTTPKDNPLVQVPIECPEPTGQINPLLAHWTYGLGKSLAFTTDAGQRWTTAWSTWPHYSRLFSQMVRWSMRSLERGHFSIATVEEDGKVRIVADALDKDSQFLNFLTVSGVLLTPDMQTRALKLEQTAPGRYEGVFDAEQAGSYFVSLGYQGPGDVQGIVRTGVSVPYSAEFRELQANRGLLEQLVALIPKGGARGRMIQGGTINEWLNVNVFRRDLAPATSSQDVWQWLVFIAGVLFFFDVLVRRVAISLAWVIPVAQAVVGYVSGRAEQLAPIEYIERLRARKQEVSQQLQRTRAAQHYEPPPEALADTDVLKETAAGPGAATPASPKPEKPSVAPEKPKAEESFTQRLMKAKKRVWEERDKK